VAYLSCPDCGTTYFDRNPLTSPHRCPRCAISQGKTVELRRSTGRGGAAAASLLRPPFRERRRGVPPEDAADPEAGQAS
jgi:hypothetical protein